MDWLNFFLFPFLFGVVNRIPRSFNPSSLPAYAVSKAGAGAYDGDYYLKGEYASNPYYTLDWASSYFLFWSVGDSKWALSDSLGGKAGYLSNATTLPGNPWSVEDAAGPAPEVNAY